jgi:hypothetical protein
MLFIFIFYFIILTIIWLVYPFFTLNLFLLNFNIIYFSIIQFIHLSLQYYIYLFIFWYYFLFNFIFNFLSFFYLFNLLIYTGIIWTFSNYYWNNWWVFEDFEEIFAIFFNSLLLLYLHFYSTYQLNWWNLIFLMLFWHLLLKFLKFPTRHAGLTSNFIGIFFFLYIYRTFLKPYYYKRSLNFLPYSIFLLPILQYSIIPLNFQHYISYFFNDVFLFWLLLFKNSLNKILIIYYSFITYQYILLLFCFNIYLIENLHFVGFCFIYLNFSLPSIFDKFFNIFNFFIYKFNIFTILVTNFYYLYFYKIYILYFCVLTLFFLTVCFLFIPNMRWIFTIRILS